MKIKRKTDEQPKILNPRPYGGKALCPNCKDGQLRALKSDGFNLTCVICGEKVPLNEVKYDSALTQDGLVPSSLVVSKAEKWSRKITKPRGKNPIEQELENKGLQLIDSDWRDNR